MRLAAILIVLGLGLAGCSAHDRAVARFLQNDAASSQPRTPASVYSPFGSGAPVVVPTR